MPKRTFSLGGFFDKISDIARGVRETVNNIFGGGEQPPPKQQPPPLEVPKQPPPKPPPPEVPRQPPPGPREIPPPEEPFPEENVPEIGQKWLGGRVEYWGDLDTSDFDRRDLRGVGKEFDDPIQAIRYYRPIPLQMYLFRSEDGFYVIYVEPSSLS